MKGFVAAHCGANIIIQDSEKEAVRWLGKDYPYLIHGKVNQWKILEMLAYANKTFGTKVWEKGLERMKIIKRKTSEEAIGTQLVKLFSAYLQFGTNLFYNKFLTLCGATREGLKGKELLRSSGFPLSSASRSFAQHNKAEALRSPHCCGVR